MEVAALGTADQKIAVWPSLRRWGKSYRPDSKYRLLEAAMFVMKIRLVGRREIGSKML